MSDVDAVAGRADERADDADGSGNDGQPGDVADAVQASHVDRRQQRHDDDAYRN